MAHETITLNRQILRRGHPRTHPAYIKDVTAEGTLEFSVMASAEEGAIPWWVEMEKINIRVAQLQSDKLGTEQSTSVVREQVGCELSRTTSQEESGLPSVGIIMDILSLFFVEELARFRRGLRRRRSTSGLEIDKLRMEGWVSVIEQVFLRVGRSAVEPSRRRKMMSSLATKSIHAHPTRRGERGLGSRSLVHEGTTTGV
ncbi:uncharacterized protein EV420DRAFT_1485129 [Desarmillaria tabescens]|uniref:Uncharacterized protein n=1 Tax=Armillaria tabescens TaxID=1929756 RepID=A0AA39JHT1_ARMTA|nr:uncharacterized protein EV420DRAFT_1485129 [Desarmillaria tabescens]KAK0443020.1 hypothetical protein EV420DRAFT_1485129 [Desarmillaria tabescens]